MARFIYCKWLGRSIGDGSDKSAGSITGPGARFLKVPGNLTGTKPYIKIKVITLDKKSHAVDCALLNCHEMKKKKENEKSLSRLVWSWNSQ